SRPALSSARPRATAPPTPTARSSSGFSSHWPDLAATEARSVEASEQAAWDQRYSGPGLVWGPGPNRFVAEELAALPPGRAIDLGRPQGPGPPVACPHQRVPRRQGRAARRRPGQAPWHRRRDHVADAGPP